MKDLVAIATVRRLLLQLGYVLQPEELDAHVGPLSLWIAEPRPDLDGLTPMAALTQPDGEERVRACLLRVISTLRQSPSTDSPAPEA
jgi:hypothetical protein